MIEIPKTTQDTTPEFVTEALRSTGAVDASTRVAEVGVEAIGEGVGIVGQLARLTLRYEGPARDAPGTVVLKIPSQYPENRAVGDHFNLYEREARFYEQIGDTADVRTPRCWFNHVDLDAGEFALMLEDFGDRTLVSQVAGVDAERASQALASLAALHAAWWDTPALEDLDWMPRLSDPVNMAAGQQYRDAWPLFVEHLGGELPAAALTLGERIKEVWEVHTQARNDAVAPSITHGDFRIDNLMFDDRATGRDRVGVIDWQISFRGPAVFDVCYLLTQSMPVEIRRRSEEAVVRSWYEELVDQLGGEPPGFSWEDAWFEYRAHTLAATVYPVTSAGSMDPANERGRRLVAAMARRSFTACLDHHAEELLPS